MKKQKLTRGCGEPVIRVKVQPRAWPSQDSDGAFLRFIMKANLSFKLFSGSPLPDWQVAANKAVTK